MARVVVDVMPKPEILDPQGKAVTGALARLGFAGVTVRQGKRFELDVEGELTEERLAEVQRAAETLLANTVIETFNVRVEGAESAGVEAPDGAASEPPEGNECRRRSSGGTGRDSRDSPGQSPGGAASGPRRGGAEAVAARVEDRGEGGGDSPGQSPGGAASEPASRGGEAVAARVEDQGMRSVTFRAVTGWGRGGRRREGGGRARVKDQGSGGDFRAVTGAAASEPATEGLRRSLLESRNRARRRTLSGRPPDGDRRGHSGAITARRP